MTIDILLVILSQLFICSHLSTGEDLYEGSPCLMENGNEGVCKKLPECPPRLKEVKNHTRDWGSTGRCGFDNFVEIVCCPLNVSEKLSKRPAESACEQQRSDEEVSFHIYNGVEAQSKEFPYVVALGFNNTEEDGPSIVYSCGGSLISTEHVLTAAHCVRNAKNLVPIEVRVGDEDLSSTGGSVQRIPISDIIIHPKYRIRTVYNDVAILKLKKKVELSNTVKPICLQTRSLNTINMTSNTSLVVLGWGATSLDSEGSNRLMRTPSLSIVGIKECNKSYSGFSISRLTNGIDDNMICVIDSDSNRLSDSCLGDSGGPLVMLAESGDSVIGITAFGSSCGSTIPSIYMAVHRYLDWIEEHVWPSVNNEPKPRESDVFKWSFNLTIT
ncbi:PREDICTED: venom protease-like [Dufourea novaeangliae]|uniref:venom protease-like n=1 Tax=Dufourea novaeangliae TaxID=178035 RepID=UPI0007672638|nr:PREDICTED: venom protease-like [Dufourea novaeangliae]